MIMSANSWVYITLKWAAFVQKDGDAAALTSHGGIGSDHHGLSWAVGSPLVLEQQLDGLCRALAEVGMDIPIATGSCHSDQGLALTCRDSSQIGWAAGLETSSLWGIRISVLPIERTLEERCDSCTSPVVAAGETDLLLR